MHRDDEHPAVGEPAETGRRTVEAGDDLDRARGIDPQHLVRVHVGDPERTVVPARTFQERAVFDDGLERGHVVLMPRQPTFAMSPPGTPGRGQHGARSANEAPSMSCGSAQGSAADSAGVTLRWSHDDRSVQWQ